MVIREYCVCNVYYVLRTRWLLLNIDISVVVYDMKGCTILMAAIRAQISLVLDEVNMLRILAALLFCHFFIDFQ